ncbi:MAG: nitroreductase family protein [Verrucomicrobiota bacterium JB025]|nr:nitroreductase family protein [Verrucomicrobiota bacterium JB025]
MIKRLHLFKRWLNLQLESFCDSNRFFAAVPQYGLPSEHAPTHLESDIVRRYHVIEKGLSMPDFRPKFGVSTVEDLKNLLLGCQDNECLAKQLNQQQLKAAYSTLDAYRKRHEELGIDLGGLLDGLEFPDCTPGMGGTRRYQPPTPEQGQALLNAVSGRASIRSFHPDRIPSDEDIVKAVEIARTAPSVCNRQTGRIHTYTGEDATKLLELQNGNRGFGHRVPMILVVTSDMRHFTGTDERYQAWIDGGLFGMMLLLGLHATGLGAVALNWAATNKRDRALRKRAAIPDHERIIMLVACGYPEPDALVPVSLRRETEHFLTRH